jgi:hypothetical protein
MPKHGRTHAAMVANFIRYRGRSAVRDVGKVLGIPETGLERLARVITHHEFPSAEHGAQAGLPANSAAHEHLFRLAKEIEDFPRHLLIRSKTHSRRFAPEKRGDFAEIGRRFGRNQYRDWGVGLGDFGGESPGRQTRLGRRAVGLWPQSDGRRVPASPAAHLNRGERGGPETDRRPSFG